MVQGKVRPQTRGRRCRRCKEPIRWNLVRLVGSHVYCSEACAIISLTDEASRTSWILTTLELRRGPRSLRRHTRLLLARWYARQAQRRLDRRLEAGPRAQTLPWIWLPTRPAAAGLVLALVAWGVTLGPVRESQVMLPAATPMPLSLAPRAPSPSPAPPQAIIPSATPSAAAAPLASVPALPVVPPVPPAARPPRPSRMLRGMISHAAMQASGKWPSPSTAETRQTSPTRS